MTLFIETEIINVIAEDAEILQLESSGNRAGHRYH